MSAGYGPPAVNTFGMITGLGDAFGKSYDAARKQAQEDEAPDLLGRLLAVQAGSTAPAGGTLGTMTDSYQKGRARLPSFASTGDGMGDYLQTVRGVESGGNPTAWNPNSTATGIDQFTQGTWNGLAKKYPDLGLTPNGRTDPEQSTRAMEAFTRDNANALSKAGVPVTPGNLYVSHFLGEAGGPRFIVGAMSNPDAPATLFVTPGAAAANRTIFYNRDGSPKSAAEVYAERTGRFPGGTSPAPTLPTQLAGGPAMTMPGASTTPTGMAPVPTQMASAPLPQAPASVAQADPDAADKPTPNAQPASFLIPGQGAIAPSPASPQGFAGFGSPGSRITPAQQEILSAAWKNPVTRPMATQIYGELLKGKQSQWQLQTMGDQPVLFNQTTAQIVPVGQAKRQTATVGNTVIDLATGQPIYQGERAPQTVASGSALVDPRTGQVIYQAPEKDNDKLQSVAPGTTLYDPRARQPVFTAPPAEKPEKDEGAKITAQIEARKAQATGLGLIEGTPAWQSFVGTGKIGRDQDLSATDKKAIQEADEGVLSAQTAIDALKQAKTLSPQAYSGLAAGMRGSAASMVGSDAGVATEDLKNIVTTNALGQLKAIFGGNPTEGERAILLDIQGSVNQPDVVRQKIFDRGMALAQKRLDFNQKRADDLRGGTYYKQDGAPAGQSPRGDRQPPSLPVRVTSSMKPDDVMKRYPSGTRLILPDGSEGVVP